jgi:glycosyltransferase involved in cell wall biosynthesis
MAIASVIIPAHNEAGVIGRCLRLLLADTQPDEIEVIVVPNGCTDETAEMASQYPEVTVLPIETASKIAALNTGDQAATTFPRIYLDADIQLTTEALRATVDALASNLAAAPSARFDTSRSSLPVRAFYRCWQRTSFLTNNPIGNGIYGLSEEGRSRFEAFPNVTADDLFVMQLFETGERCVLPEHAFIISAPRNLRSLIKVRTRVYSGNQQLGAATSRTSLTTLVRRSTGIGPTVDLVAYLVVNSIAKVRSRISRKTSWQRDDSSRN